jgi:hypothetical protein
MENKNIKFFISPMSKHIVDCVLTFNSKEHVFGFIPTRRQIEHDSGYVNNWTTQTFSQYVNKRAYIVRDHGGSNQGSVPDDGMYSFAVDSKYLDCIHIDPWIKYPSTEQGLEYTVEVIKYLHKLNNRLKYEVLTEQAIRYFSEDQIQYFIEELQNRLTSEEYNCIEYAVIQSGVGLDLVQQTNTGKFSVDRLNKMVNTVKQFGIKTKEHNGDYLTPGEISLRFKYGLDSLNIGPEIAQIQTKVYLDNIDKKNLDIWYKACLDSGKWKKWKTDTLDLDDKEKVIQVCGHYTFSDVILPNIDSKINQALTHKLNELYEASR